MRRYWAMKTYKEWHSTFVEQKVIGIDQDGVDSDYLSLTEDHINELIQSGISESIERNFRQFTKWMNPGDYVIIGTGQTTKFNISAIAKVTGEYYFDTEVSPRHVRKVELVKVFKEPTPLQRFSRVARIELIDEIDFHESIISLLE
ncbi:hypothetical protein L4D00_22855 [Photobacterium swingsii]|nr:hypothetical protein [Vibrio vulnificus]HCG8768792.1 hypothetical protein [Vibrio parahaemolyticus]HDY7777646.1 hypothetical protein [Vibrio vulnificus]HDY8002478.1 hypothetical protein [Vibrio vulnificus]